MLAHVLFELFSTSYFQFMFCPLSFNYLLTFSIRFNFYDKFISSASQLWKFYISYPNYCFIKIEIIKTTYVLWVGLIGQNYLPCQFMTINKAFKSIEFTSSILAKSTLWISFKRIKSEIKHKALKLVLPMLLQFPMWVVAPNNIDCVLILKASIFSWIKLCHLLQN